jgi:hypothetical protein
LAWSLKEDGEKSNRLMGVARLAMKLGREHVSDCGAVTSRKDFTQRQLMACLVLRAYLKTTYRGVIEFLETSERLRASWRGRSGAPAGAGRRKAGRTALGAMPGCVASW